MKKYFSILALLLSYTTFAQNVGIGEANPIETRLQVKRADSALLLLHNSSSGADVKTGLFFKSGGSYSGSIITTGNTATQTFRMGFSTFGSPSPSGLIERISINDIGNVGIGNINPLTKLDINGQIKISGGTPGVGKLLESDATGLATWSDKSASFLPTGASGNTLRHNGTAWIANSLLYNNGANIGIGTINPLSKLEVFGSGFGFQQNDGTVSVGTYTSATGGWLGTRSNHPLHFYSNNSAERMTLSTAGNFGIGTTNPTYLLDVNGRGRLRHNGATAGLWFNKADNTEAAFVGMFNDTTFGFYGSSGWSSGFDVKNNLLGVGVLNPTAPLSFPNSIGNKIALWGDAAGGHYGLGIQGALLQMYSSGSNADIAFGHGNSNSFTENMRIKGNGNIGVGVSNPTSKMEILETTNTNSRALYVGVNNASSSNEALRAESISGSSGIAILAYRNGNGNAILATTLAGIGINAGSGNASQDVAVKGSATTGLWGTATSNGGFGVRASNGGIGSATGLWAQGYSFVSGNFEVIGTLSKSAGTFKIDHPQDPQNKFLIHSFVESPDMMNVYNGNISTDNNGFATITLPSYFEALNIDFKYQLTIVGKEFAQALVYEKIKSNQFIVRTDKPNIEVSWQVTGVRNDKYAQQNRIVPEVEKTTKQKGKYLNAEAFGASEEKQITPNDR